MISCDEATTISDQKQYNEAKFWDRIKMGIHVMMCKKCYIYDKQNKVLSKIIEVHKLTDKPESTLKVEDKKVMQHKINK